MKRFSKNVHSLCGALVCGATLALAGQAQAETLISVDTAGCSTNMAINNAIGQSFQVGSPTSVESIEVWIKPELYYTTSYTVEVYDGEGTGGTKLATSSTTVTLGSQTAGVASGFQVFTFSGLSLEAHHAYTFKLVRLSQYSGAFSECGDVYSAGKEYWLGYSAQNSRDISFKLNGTATPAPDPEPTPVEEPLISVETAGCNTNVAINNAIGQSFRVAKVTRLQKIEFWIKPELYYTTSYAMELYDGEGTGGTKLATSPTTVTLGSQTAGVPSAFQGFSFAGVTLQPDHAYTFKLVRLSQYSGAFSKCGNVYPHGIQYWLGSYSDTPYDASFKLYGSETLALESLSWSAAGPGTRSATADGSATDAMTFDYSLSGSSVWSAQSWTYSATAPRDTTLEFGWNYTGFHAWYRVNAQARAFADGPNGRAYVDLYSRNYGDGWNVSGTASLELHEGYAFGFIIDGSNYDSDSRLLGTLKVTSQP
ncbi:hypothetical protein [Hyalangium gracile]|uniref:hypothetical protein n=1 Tax=Hyalangium gracile TaxID=394092 RepID=UPI001CCE2777|nr:hypothetical protein [Hyalangium gracile]